MTIRPSFLDPDEVLVWSGRPNPFSYAMTEGLFRFFLSFIPLLPTLYLLWLAQVSGAFSFVVAAIPFAILTVVLVLAPAWCAWKANRMLYVLTSRRVVIDTAAPFANRRSYPLDRIRFIDLQQRRGAEHVIFHEETIESNDGGEMTELDGFIAIPNAAQTADILRSQVAQASRAQQQ